MSLATLEDSIQANISDDQARYNYPLCVLDVMVDGICTSISFHTPVVTYLYMLVDL